MKACFPSGSFSRVSLHVLLALSFHVVQSIKINSRGENPFSVPWPAPSNSGSCLKRQTKDRENIKCVCVTADNKYKCLLRVESCKMLWVYQSISHWWFFTLLLFLFMQPQSSSHANSLFDIRKIPSFLSLHANQMLAWAMAISCTDYLCGEAQLDCSECGNASGLQLSKVGQCYPTTDQTVHPTCSWPVVIYADQQTTRQICCPLLEHSCSSLCKPSSASSSKAVCAGIFRLLSFLVPQWWNDLPSSVRAGGCRWD